MRACPGMDQFLLYQTYAYFTASIAKAIFVQTKLVMSDWLAKKGDEVTRANKQKRQNWCLQCCFQNNHVSHRAIKCLVFVDWICCSWEDIYVRVLDQGRSLYLPFGFFMFFLLLVCFVEEDKLTRRYFCKCRETFFSVTGGLDVWGGAQWSEKAIFVY